MATSDFKINGVGIGPNYKPFIIAEMSGNHNHSLERALQIVDAAADAGVSALKIQTYTADTMTIDSREKDFVVSGLELWNDTNLYELYKMAYTPWEWHEPIFKRCQERGIIGFSTPFDETAVDFLEGLNVPFYKIASFENTHLPLIKKVAQTGKPMIVSTGMASVGEIEDVVRTARENGCHNLVLLKCTSTYPASPQDTHISTIPHMRTLFDTQVGLSDHTMGVGVSVASITLGATVIEKHFTLKRSDGGVDSAFSLEPSEMASLVVETERAWQSIGSVQYGKTSKEQHSAKYRRSIYVVEDIKPGEKFTKENVRIIRPGLGLAPKYIDLVIGKIAKTAFRKGEALTFEKL